MAVWLLLPIAGLIFFLTLFICVDVWYFVRAVYVFLTQGWHRRDCKTHPLSEDELFKEHVTNGIVMFSDLDLNLHMNNSKYLRELDFGRVGIWLHKGIRDVLLDQRAIILVNAINVRYRRSLELFQRFEVHTKIVAWEEKALYLEQRMITKDKFVVAIALVKMAVRGASTDDIVASMCGGKKISSPKPSAELRAWQESINVSSKRLKEECGTTSNRTTQTTKSIPVSMVTNRHQPSKK